MPSFSFSRRRFITAPILVDEGYSQKGGFATGTDTPGCGLVIEEKALGKQAKVFLRSEELA